MKTQISKSSFNWGFVLQLPHDEILNPANRYRYDLVPMFQNETISGRVYAVLTAYFVHPCMEIGNELQVF